jgi:HD-like signal output (HDOD) protein
LYILTRATDQPGLFGSDTELNGIIEDWHASIGKAILENWEFPEAMAQAVGDQGSSREDEGAADLADVVAASILIASYGTDIAGLQIALHDHPGAKRLGLDEARTLAVMQDSAAEVTALSQAFGA